MTDITVSWRGRKITISDDGDHKLGSGDFVRIDGSPAKPVDDAKLNEQLREAGLDLKHLLHANLDMLQGVLNAMERIRNKGSGKKEINISSLKQIAQKAGASPSDCVSDVYCSLVRDRFEAWLNAYPTMSQDDRLTSFRKVQELAANTNSAFPSVTPTDTTLDELAAEACIRMINIAPSRTAAIRWIDLTRDFVQKTGFANDEYGAAKKINEKYAAMSNLPFAPSMSYILYSAGAYHLPPATNFFQNFMPSADKAQNTLPQNIFGGPLSLGVKMYWMKEVLTEEMTRPSR
ncbi:MAG: hypothetical protein WC956_02450 [bacterium]